MAASEKAWLDRQRAEREEEFAPPSFYYDMPTKQPVNQPKTSYKKISGGSTNEKTHTKDELSDTSSSIDKNAINELVGKHLHLIHESADFDTSVNNSSRFSVIHQDIVPNSGDIQMNFQAPPTNIPESPSSLQSPLPDWTPPLPSNEPPSNNNFLYKALVKSQTVIVTPSSIIPPFHNIQVPPPSLQVPPPNMQIPPSNMYVPPPNIQVPPPNIQVPPPNIRVPPPNIQVPPPNTHVHPPNIKNPPPNYQVPPPNFVSQAQNYYSIAENHPTTAVSYQANISEHQANKTVEANSESNAVPPKPRIPKLSIIDTRLMGND